MRILLTTNVRKAVFVSGGTTAAVLAFVLCCQSFAEYWSARPATVEGFQNAARIQPLNAYYPKMLGIASIAVDQQEAISLLQRSARINAYDSQTWLALSTVYGINDRAKQYGATMQALAVDPTSVDVEWEASQLLLQNGQTDEALRLLRKVSTNDPARVDRVIQAAFRATGKDVSRMLEATPATTTGRLQLLGWLLVHDEPSAADRVWSSIEGSKETVRAGELFVYMDSLIGRQQVSKAEEVWKFAMSSDGRGGDAIDLGNLVIDGGFERDILNGGFGWRYTRVDGVLVTMDTSTFHEGMKSLGFRLDGDRIAEAGVHELVPVDPSSYYAIRAFAHSEELVSANGMRLAVTDYYSGKMLFISDEIPGSTSWRELSGGFGTPSDTRLLKVSIVRSPLFGRIRGKFWLDDVRMEKLERGWRERNPK